MRRRSSAFSILVVSVAFCSAIAAEGFVPPDTPAGACAAGYFEAFNAADEAMAAYFRRCLSDESLRQRSVEERLARYRGFRGELGQLRPDRVIAAESTSTVVLVESSTGQWLEFTFESEPTPPHKLIGIRIEQTDPTDQAQPRTPLTEREFLDSLSRRLEQMARDDEFSGVVLVAKEDRPIFQQAYGLANKEFAVPNRLDTRFNLGSINKIFTRMAIGQLRQNGKLDFADTLGKFLPDYPNPEARRSVTVAHLISMTSGVGDFFGEAFDRSPKDRFRTNRDYMPMFDTLPLAFPPGSQRQYSNGGYVLLGVIIEVVSGKSYYDYVREHIFVPTGMTETDSYEADVPVSNLADGYSRADENRASPRRNNIYTRPARGSSAGGGYSTVGDLLKFLIALKSSLLLGPAYTEWLLTDTHPDSVRAADSPSPQARVLHQGGIGVAGGAPGINASLEADFASGYAVIVLGNYDPPNTERVARLARRWLERVKPE